MEQLIKEQYKTYSRITQLQKNFKENPSTSKETITARREMLDKYYKQFQDTDSEINKIVSTQAMDTTKENYFKKDLSFQCEVMYTLIKGKLLEIRPSPDSSEPKKRRSSAKSKSESSVKLPKLDVPKFSGKFTEWPAFRRDFVRLVHSNKNLSNEQKFVYLKSVVPYEIIEDKIKHISETSDNFTEVWKSLEEIFNDRAVLESLLIKLMEQPGLRGKSADIQKLLDTTTNCLKALQTIGIDTSSWDALLIYAMVQRMDRETRSEWYKSHSCHERPSIDDLYKFLDCKIDDLKKIEETNKNIHLPRVEFGCVYCKESHSLWHCLKFELLDIDSRLSFVKHNPVCPRCLTPNHTIASCRKEYRCLICNKDHHFLLHKNHHRFQNGDGDTRLKITNRRREEPE